jgi:hypothetical protein
MQRALLIVIAVAALAGTARAAQLPGVVTPSGNIHCFAAPVAGTTKTDLVCNIAHALYAPALAQFCGTRPQSGLDWKGFELTSRAKGTIICAHGALHKPSDTLAFRPLRYGKTWRHGAYACVSRTTGVTCTNAARHGIYVGRVRYRLF